MSFPTKEWHNRGSGKTPTPINDVGMNDLENRILNGFSNIDSDSVKYNGKTLSKMITDVSGGTDGGLCVKQYVRSCNFNELPNYGSGLFIAFGPCTNAPSESGSSNMHWYVIQLVLNNTHSFQFAFRAHSARDAYIRRQVAGSWESWQQHNL